MDIDGQPGTDRLPALLCTEEVSLDDGLKAYNLVNGEGTLAWNLALARQSLELVACEPGSHLTFISVPAMFFHEELSSAKGDVVKGASAFLPGATNLQFADGRYFVPRQFAPRKPATNGPGTVDIFEESIKSSVSGPVFFVDCWDLYHRRWGEIHCGTAVRRAPPEKAWWKALLETEPENQP